MLLFAITARAAPEPVLVVAGGQYVAILMPDGNLWTAGGNAWGQLGKSTPPNLPVLSLLPVGATNEWLRVSTGWKHTLALKRNGTLWAWGCNADGQLGIGNNEPASTPVPVGKSEVWLAIAAGDRHSLGIKADGTLWAWGNNTFGQLGLPETNSLNTPVQISENTDWLTAAAGVASCLALRKNGTLWAWGRQTTNQTFSGIAQVGTDSDWTAITCGAACDAALKQDGSIWILQSEPDSFTPKPAMLDQAGPWNQISAGIGHFAAIKTDGSLWTWGANSFGQIGNNTRDFCPKPTRIGADTKWVSVAAGENLTVAACADGTTWWWGCLGGLTPAFSDNQSLQPRQFSFADSAMLLELRQEKTQQKEIIEHKLGTEPLFRPLAAGKRHTLAIRRDGALWAWGDNSSGQLGDGTTALRPLPAQIGTHTNWAAVAAGHAHSVALKTDGTLWAWGENGFGQLGLGENLIKQQTMPVQIGTNSNWYAIAAGAGHTLALRQDGALWAWGWNDKGQLGSASTRNSYEPRQVGIGTDPMRQIFDSKWTAISANGHHTLALRDDGSLWAWGNNNTGQLGLGARSTPTKGSPCQVGSETNWAATAAGDRHSLAMKIDGTLWTWGDNSSGQIGSTNAMVFAPIKIMASTGWLDIAAGEAHSLATSSDGQLWSWGENRSGQLGLGDTEAKRKPQPIQESGPWLALCAGAEHSVAMRTNGDLWVWGEWQGRIGESPGLDQLFPAPLKFDESKPRSSP